MARGTRMCPCGATTPPSLTGTPCKPQWADRMCWASSRCAGAGECRGISWSRAGSCRQGGCAAGHTRQRQRGGPLPRHWRMACGCDHGISHPSTHRRSTSSVSWARARRAARQRRARASAGRAGVPQPPIGADRRRIRSAMAAGGAHLGGGLSATVAAVVPVVRLLAPFSGNCLLQRPESLAASRQPFLRVCVHAVRGGAAWPAL